MNNIRINNNNNNQFIQVSMDLAKHSGFTNWGDYKSNRITTNQFLVRGGEAEYPEENLSEKSRAPTNPTHIWQLIRELNPGHIGGGRMLSPQRQPCFLPEIIKTNCRKTKGNFLLLAYINLRKQLKSQNHRL